MALADSAGLPVAVSIADGSRHDVTLVEPTLDQAVTEHLPQKLVGDKAFDSYELAERLREQRYVELIAPNNPRHRRRKQDGRALRRYQRRWHVERLLAWLKRFRRIALRWERKATNFLGFVQLGCAVILLRQ